MANSMSSWDLPTPENTTIYGSPVAAKTQWSSPPETISKPAPFFASKFNMAILGLDFTAKQMRWSIPSNWFLKSR